MIEFKIIEAGNSFNNNENNFEKRVQEHLNEGWTLHGPIMQSHQPWGTFVQALVKYPNDGNDK